MQTFDKATKVTNWSRQARQVVGRIDDLVELMGRITDPDSVLTNQFHAVLCEIETQSRECPDERAQLRSYCLAATATELSKSRVHRQGRDKPFGYAGDFQIIDWTYTHFDGSDGKGKVWDQFYHQQDAPRAVCDRKERFGRVLRDIRNKPRDGTIRVLNIASGPCREILDGTKYASLAPEDLQVVCVEIDSRAIDYAKRVLGDDWSQSVQFHCGNAIRFRPLGEFDLVWCAGLFDYLDERSAEVLLRKMWKAVGPGGRLVVGNFASSHQTRPWIEWCGDWFLRHRDESDLFSIAREAGMPEAAVSIETDQWGAISFIDAINEP